MENIRLVIWDMDETFWQETLAEGKIVIPELHEIIIIELTNRVIINSIASKNEFDKVKEELVKNSHWEYLALPQISWEGKESTVKYIVECVKLRFENILFIDDNAFNREEVEFCMKSDNTYLLDVPKKIKSDSDYTDNIRHYTRKFYYLIAMILELLMAHDILEAETYKLERGDFRTKCRRLIKRREDSKPGEDLRQNIKKVLRKLGILELAYRLIDKFKERVTNTNFINIHPKAVSFEVVV